MQAEFSKFGPRHDYRHAHVTLKVGGRTLLGEIMNVYRDGFTGYHHARVRHMDGSAWPFEPALSALNILERATP